MREALDALIQLAAYRHSTPAIRKPRSTKSLYYPTRDEVAGGGRGFEPSVPPRLKQVRDRGMIAPQRRQVVATVRPGMRRWWRRLKFVVRVTCEQPASFQNRVSLAQSASVPEPIETQTSIPTSAGCGRPARSGCAAGRTRRARWPRVDAGVLDRVPLALERDMRLGPQRVHDLDLLL